MEPFEIKIHVSDERELYSPFDPDRFTLNENLLQYLIDRYSEKEFRKRAVLIFSGAELNEEHLKTALRRHVEGELDKNRREKKFNLAKQVRLALIGLAFVSAGILLGKVLEAIPVEILSIIGSFAVWEAANIWIVENPALNLRKRLLNRLLEAEIIVNPDH